MSHTGNSTTAQLQLLCNHTQIMEHVTHIMEHHCYYSNYGTQLLLFQNMGHSPIQIMGHFKNHGTYSQSYVHPYMY